MAGDARRSGVDLAVFAAVAAAAFAVRLTPLLVGGGLGSYGRYDDGVYYTAADELVHGRWPYRDFILLHPPGIAVVLTPFAELGRLTSDSFGYACGRVAFMMVGAANTLLVALLARRWGRVSAVVAGVVYATWKPAVYGEESTLLEPLGTTALLIALLLLLRRDALPTRRHAVCAGAALGAAISLKIWYVAPFAAICLWLLGERRLRTAAQVAISGIVAAGAVMAPFAVAAGARMWDLVVRDQLLRPAGNGPAVSARVQSMLGVRSLLPTASQTSVTVLTRAAVVLMAAAALRCLLDRGARVFVVLLAVNIAVLVASPSYFSHYANLTAAPATLVLGVGLAQLSRSVPWRMTPPVIAALAVLGAGYSAYRVAGVAQGQPFAASELRHAAPPGCVASDFPEQLILMNRLSSDLAHGCRVPDDISPQAFDGDFAFQQFHYNYLVSSSSFLTDRKPPQITADIYRLITAHPAIATTNGLTLRLGDRTDAGESRTPVRPLKNLSTARSRPAG